MNNTQHFVYRFPRARQPSRDIPADANFLCDKDIVLWETIKEKNLYNFKFDVWLTVHRNSAWIRKTN
jgi:hypothetical protein